MAARDGRLRDADPSRRFLLDEPAVGGRARRARAVRAVVGRTPRVDSRSNSFARGSAASLWVGPQDLAHRGESYWFTEGVARFFVTRLLARVGLVRPDEVRDALVGETSVILASHHKGESNEALAARAATDAFARAHLVARGALYAARVNALLRDHS